MLVTLNAAADPASRKALIDPNAIDKKGLTSIDWFAVSPDGTKVAVSLSRSGSEDGTLHVYDVATGKEIDKPIADVQFPTAGGSAAWTRDATGFWYTRYPGAAAPEADRHFFQAVYFHKLGTDAAKDPLVLGPKNGLERVSEIYLDTRYGGDEGFVQVQRGDGNRWAFYVLPKSGAPIQIATYDDHFAFATLGAGRRGLCDQPRRRAERQDRAAEAALRAAGAGQGAGHRAAKQRRDPVGRGGGAPARPGAQPRPALRARHHRRAERGPRLCARRQADGKLPRCGDRRQHRDRAAGRRRRAVQRRDLSQADLLRALASFDRQGRGDGTQDHLARVLRRCAGGARLRDLEGRHQGPGQHHRRKGAKLDGTNPTLLYGYGGYGISSTPYFLGPMWRLWLDAGGVYADANIRGGSEYGERWHTQGMLLKKQNVFDDFAAVAQYLIDRKYTSHERLALLGGSNGGLLMARKSPSIRSLRAR